MASLFLETENISEERKEGEDGRVVPLRVPCVVASVCEDHKSAWMRVGRGTCEQGKGPERRRRIERQQKILLK